MSSSDEPLDRVLRVIEDYIEENGHLLKMERIHQSFFDEDIEFLGWDSVYNEYRSRDWDDDKARSFTKLAKEIVDGLDDIAETYFRITEPNELSLKFVTEELSKHPYDETAEGKNRAGFDFDVVDDVVEARYVYTDINTRLTYAGGVDEYVSEGALEFQIVPRQNLLVLNSTRVTDVQKMKKYIKKTSMEIVVSRDLTSIPDQAVDRINGFIDSFHDDVDADGPSLMQVDRVIMHNPPTNDAGEQEERIDKLDFEGSNIRNHPDVRSHLDNGWIIKGITAVVQYQGSFYPIRVSGNEVMGYAKVENVSNYDVGEELMAQIRSRYLEHIA